MSRAGEPVALADLLWERKGPALRQIGTLPETEDPGVFGDYLLSLGVSWRSQDGRGMGHLGP